MRVAGTREGEDNSSSVSSSMLSTSSAEDVRSRASSDSVSERFLLRFRFLLLESLCALVLLRLVNGVVG